MTEHLPSPERDPKTEEELINDAILEANKKRTVISDAAARVIAGQLHEGQASALYALSSSGVIIGGLLEEIDRDMCSEKVEPIARYWAEKLEMYVMVRVQEERTDPVEGWSKIWLGSEQDRVKALTDRAQKLYDENVTYLEFAEEFGREELIELWALCGDGMTYSFDDEVYDALQAKYRYFDGGES